MRLLVAAAALLSLSLATSALAADYRCVGERIEKGSSTWGKAVSTGSDFRIEKGSSTIGWAKKRNSDYAIETAGNSTLGWLKGTRIESAGNSTIGSLSDAQRLAEACPDAVATALWVLQREGRL